MKGGDREGRGGSKGEAKEGTKSKVGKTSLPCSYLNTRVHEAENVYRMNQQKQDMRQDMRQSMRQGMRQDMRQGMRQDMRQSMRQGMRQGMRHGMRQAMRQEPRLAEGGH